MSNKEFGGSPFLERFRVGDHPKVIETIESMSQHIDFSRIAFVGSVAARGGIVRGFHDLDVTAKDLTVIKPSYSEEFYASHHHENDADNVFWMKLIHRKNLIGVDIFHDKMPPERVDEVQVGKTLLRLQSPEDQLSITAQENYQLVIGNISALDRRYLQNAEVLLTLSDPQVAEKNWQNKMTKFPERFEGYPTTLKETIHETNDYVEKNQDKIIRSEVVFNETDYYSCDKCIPHPQFPIVTKEEGLANLGMGSNSIKSI